MKITHFGRRLCGIFFRWVGTQLNHLTSEVSLRRRSPSWIWRIWSWGISQFRRGGGWGGRRCRWIFISVMTVVVGCLNLIILRDSQHSWFVSNISSNSQGILTKSLASYLFFVKHSYPWEKALMDGWERKDLRWYRRFSFPKKGWATWKRSLDTEKNLASFFLKGTVDDWNPAWKPVEVGGLAHYWQGFIHPSGQIIATSHDLTPNCGLVKDIPLFQGNLGWWNIIIRPDPLGFFFHQQYLKAVEKTRGWQHRHHLLPTFEGANNFFFRMERARKWNGVHYKDLVTWENQP